MRTVFRLGSGGVIAALAFLALLVPLLILAAPLFIGLVLLMAFLGLPSLSIMKRKRQKKSDDDDDDDCVDIKGEVVSSRRLEDHASGDKQETSSEKNS